MQKCSRCFFVKNIINIGKEHMLCCGCLETIIIPKHGDDKKQLRYIYGKFRKYHRDRRCDLCQCVMKYSTIDYVCDICIKEV